MKSRLAVMKRTSLALIIALIVSICAPQVVSYSVEDREGRVYLMTLNVCAVSHEALSQGPETPCISECAFGFVPHGLISCYPSPEHVRFASLPASERDQPPRFPA